MKVKLTLHRPYGNVEIEGESFDEIVANLQNFPEWLDVIDDVVSRQLSETEIEESLKGIVETTADGPVITVPRDRITDREAVGLLLYTSSRGLRPRDLGRYLSLSGFLSAGFASRISELKREGFAYKEGDAYKLTAAGKRWVEELIRKLKGVG
jgi:hypothetical protein